ncbi:MAG: GC-type dockerin domain-anchored protein [Phycisphaerales bacterium]
MDQRPVPGRRRGAYDEASATLSEGDTKVYEGKIGVDEDVSAVTGIPTGPSFHFAVSNVWYKDNRIPPRGFTQAGFEAVQAQPVGYHYDDGQYWDDTRYAIPPRAARAEVSVYYQTASRAYIEFLRDENATNDAGQVMFEQWEQLGKSPPVLMDEGSIDLPAPCAADLDGDGVLTLFDFLRFQNLFDSGDPRADFDGDGSLTIFDFLAFQNAFDAGC